MKKISIIGGLAWPSTADYYRLHCKKANENFRASGQRPPYATPPMVIESLNINATRTARGTDGDEDSWVTYVNTIAAHVAAVLDTAFEGVYGC